MAITTRPVLQRVSAIDANKPYTFMFNWNGKPIMGSVLTITNAQNGAKVLEIESTKNLSSIDYDPSMGTKKLTNGKQYKATVKVIYNENYIDTSANSAESYESDSIQFMCFETPKLSIEELNANTINNIGMASINCNLKYDNKTHSNNILSSYRVDLYQDADLSVLINSSGIKYTKGDVENLPISIGGLIDNHTYYVYVHGITNYDMEVEGTVYQIVVHYSTRFDTAFTASVNDGHVELYIHEHIISGRWDSTDDIEEPIFIDDNTKVDAKENEVIYDKGFTINGDFKGIIKCSNILINNEFPIIQLKQFMPNSLPTPYVNYLQLIPTTQVSYVDYLKKGYYDLSGTRDVRILCLAFRENGIVTSTYSNPLQLHIVEKNNSKNYYIDTEENNDLIITLRAKNGYYDITFAKEMMDNV